MEYSSVVYTIGSNRTEFTKIYEGKTAIATCSYPEDAELVLQALRFFEKHKETAEKFTMLAGKYEKELSDSVLATIKEILP